MRKKINIAYCYKSGMGIEIARIGAWLSALSQKYDLTLYSFHHFIYNSEVMRVCPLTELNHEKVVLEDADKGIAFYCMPRSSGPFRADGLDAAARQLGYLMILEDEEGDANVYRTSYKQISDYGLKACSRVFLKTGKPHQKLILNLFGGASPTKGFREGPIAARVAREIADAFSKYEFIIPCLPHQKNVLSEVMISGVNNLELRDFNYNEENLTLLVSGSPGIITVEGGMLHLGVAYAKPVCCLIEKDWMQDVNSKLPLDHGVHYEIVELSNPDINNLLESLKQWMREQLF
jgi:hypothetical protein